MTTNVRLFRDNQQRADGLSSSSQIAKAAEHLVCCELILLGFNAIMADAGQPYDVLVDLGAGKFCRVQVKTTTRMYSRNGYVSSYRFPLRKSRTGNRKITPKDVDVFAFVALDQKQIAWMHIRNIIKSDGVAKILVELKSRRVLYKRGKHGPDANKCGKFMEDFATFPFIRRN